jgi:(p)ppGpp synthase/HD superfamily hydrolase
MSTLERAIALAATVHSGQRDKAGAPYILHPLRMMLKMKTLETQMAAMLHDVVEDCGVTPALLAHEGFPASVVAAVGALTKKVIDGAEEPYDEFIRRAALDPIARLVKLADLEDNMDLSRIAQPTEKDHRRVRKYQAAKVVIENAISSGA